MRYLLAKTEKKNQCSIINKFMYEKLCYKSSTLKNEKSNSNINISKISHLLFWYVVLFTQKYDDTVQDALTIV